MPLNSSEIESLLSTGNTLAGFFQGAADISKDPTGVDQAGALLSLAGAMSSLVGQAPSPFLEALGKGLGVNVSALGVVTAGIQLNLAIDNYQQAMQSSNLAIRDAASKELADKSLGLFAAVGGTLAAIPVPVVEQLGLGIWLAGTAAQQVLNGNAQAALDIVGTQVSDAIAYLIGGPSMSVNQYQFGSSEVITIEIVDQFGINRGEYGNVSGASYDEITLPQAMGPGVQPDGSAILRGSTPETATGPWGISDPRVYWVKSSELSLTPGQYTSSFNFLNSTYQQSLNGNYFSGNTVDFAAQTLSYGGFDWNDMSDYFTPTSLAYQYTGLMDWFSQDQSFYEDIWNTEDADLLASSKFWYLTQLESKLGDSEKRDEILGIMSQGMGSPIAIDLNGDGVRTIAISDRGVTFDITGDNIKESVGWLSAEDAFVVLDHNDNGSIDDVGEMFGGLDRGVGYAELSALDSNYDGVVSSLDKAYASLKLWQDANLNGLTDAGELRSFSDAAVTELQLSYRSQDVFDNGNLIGEVSSAVVGGSIREMADVYFRYRNMSVESQVQGLVDAMAAFGGTSSAGLNVPPVQQPWMTDVLLATPV